MLLQSFFDGSKLTCFQFVDTEYGLGRSKLVVIVVNQELLQALGNRVSGLGDVDLHVAHIVNELVDTL